MISSTPDKSLIRIYSLLWVAGYLAVYFVFRGLLPEKSLTDALYIQEVIGGIAKGTPSQGFEVMARIYGFFPQSVTWTIVGLINAFVLYNIVAQVKTFRGMMILPIVLLPFIGLNLQAPTKETLVVMMSLGLALYAEKAKTEGRFIIVATILYVLYGSMVRDYYLLIITAFLFFVAVLKSPPLLRWVYVAPVLVAMMALPESLYQSIGNARNEVNAAINYGEGSEVRTYFMNPYPSDNMIHFIGNYLYAFAMLHFPLLKSITLKEGLLFINVLFYWTWMINGILRLQGARRWLSVLFAAHIAILTIFEPDYGSYFRHFSSMILFLMPSFVYLDERRAAALRAQDSQARRSTI